MAARRKTTETPATNGGFTLPTATASTTGITRQGKASGPNPADADLLRTLEVGALAYQLPNDEETVKTVLNLLNRARQQHGLGLDKSVVDNGDGTVTINFCARTTKIARKYTAQDIRDWYKNQTGEDLPAGKIASEVRHAFKVFHGFAADDSAEKAA